MGWIIDTELIEEWLMGLDDSSYGQVIAALELLGDSGPHLGRPLVDSIVGSEHSNMKELRPGSKGEDGAENALCIWHPEAGNIFGDRR